MPYNRVQRSKEMLDPYHGEKMGFVKLSRIIMENVGADERTISSYMKLMLELKLIRDLGSSHFEIC